MKTPSLALLAAAACLAAAPARAFQALAVLDACMLGREHEAEIRLEVLLATNGRDAARDEVNALSEFGDSALVWCSKNGLARATAALLRAGADVSVRTPSGDTALTWAALGGHEAIVRDLIAHGAEVNTVLHGGAITMTPLS